MELFLQHVTGPGSHSLVEAFARQYRVFEDPLFDNVAAYGIGIGVLVGGWVASWVLSNGLWYAYTLNWRRLFNCGRRRDNDDPLFRNPNDPNESANKPKVLPVAAVRFAIPVSVGAAAAAKLKRTGDAVGVTPQVYKEVEVTQTHPESRLWSGAKRSRTESYIRLAVLLVRLLVLVATVVLAFQAAGVNVLSLAASMGIISLCLSYGGANLLRNFLNAMYIHGMDKVAINVYVKCGNGYKGIITAFRAQWSDVTDDLSPWQGRQIHQIPNAVFMENIITVFPDGPPPEDLRRYYDELAQVNTWRATRGLEPIPPINMRVWE